MAEYILFDLDGTLTDSGLGIVNCVKYALDKLNISYAGKNLSKFVGPPLMESFKEEFGFSHEQAERGVELYRERFKDIGIFENILYDGIPECLCRLKSAGKKIILATSKPEVFAIRILEHFNISEYFDFVSGSLMNNTRDGKAEVIENAINSFKIDLSSAIMVGDRKFDVIGARAFNIETVGVLWGYGTKEELSEAGALKCVETVSELTEFLLK
jgi:phosphoglycolate phosphatase